MKLIMLIDDDEGPMTYYVMAMEAEGLTVLQHRTPDEALGYAIRGGARPDLIIFDVMMPPGERYKGKAEVEEGLRTGYLLYPELKGYYPDVEYLCLSNLKSAQKAFKRIDPGVTVLHKIDVPPFELVDRVRSILGLE